MNTWISKQLNDIDIRADNILSYFETIETNDLTNFNLYFKYWKDRILCAYLFNKECHHNTKKCVNSIIDILEQCELIIKEYNMNENDEKEENDGYDSF